MKFIILSFFFLFTLNAFGQYHIEYHLKYYDRQTHEEILPKYGEQQVWQDYFVGKGYYKTYFDGGEALMQFYDGKTNKLATIDKNLEVSYSDASSYLSGLKEIKYLDTLVNILGYECKGVELSFENTKTVYFYNESIKIIPGSFKSFTNWTKILKSMGGALPLRYVSYYEEYYVVGTAINLKQVSLTADDFEYKTILKVYLEENKRKFGEIKEKYNANYTSAQIDFNKVKNLFLKGNAIVGKISLPLEGTVMYPNFMYIRMEFQGLTILSAKNSEYEWEYNGINDKGTQKPVDPKALKNVEENNFPGMNTFFDDENSAVHDFRNVTLAGNKLVKVTTFNKTSFKSYFFDSETFLIHRTDINGKTSIYEDYKLFQEVKFPSKISEIRSGKGNFSMVFDEIIFNPPIDEEIFYIPDSLKGKIIEATVEKTANDHYLEGEKYFKEQDYPKAIAAYKEAISKSPKTSLYYNQSGLAKLYHQDYYGAIGDFNTAVNLDPRFFVAHTNLGYTKKEMGDYKNALIDYNNAVAVDSLQASGYSDRGTTYYFLQEYEAALLDFKKAIKLDSSRSVDYFNVGVTLVELNKNQEAISFYNQAIDSGYNDESAYNLRGVAFFGLEDYDSALKDFEISVQKNEKEVTYWTNLGKTYSALSNSPKALNAFNRVLKLDKNNSAAYNFIGIEYFKQEDYGLAIKNFDSAVTLDPKNPTYFDNRASAKENLYDFVGAIEDYNSSLILYPDDADIVYRRGVAKVSSNNNYDACLDFKKALEMGYEIASESLTKYCDL